MKPEKTIVLAADSSPDIHIDTTKIPEESMSRLCRGALRGVKEAFEDPEFAERFRVWQEARQNA